MGEGGGRLQGRVLWGPCLTPWRWERTVRRSCAASLAGSLVALLALTPALADQVRSDNLRVSLSAEERRDQIVSLLVLRGVKSPLLEKRRNAVAPAAQKAVIRLVPPGPTQSDPRLNLLLSLIASAEAGPAGYDAIHHRAWVLPDKAPTQMTIQEIIDWIDATPRQNHAIGRYQIIPMTLSYLVAAENVPMTAVFSPALQDRLAVRLINDAGLPEFLSGQMAPVDFMDSLAFVWAGLPLGSGLSAYEGFAGNSATISRQHYETRFAEIFGLGAIPVASLPGPKGQAATPVIRAGLQSPAFRPEQAESAP